MPPVGGWPSGVYWFRNRINGKVYIGSSKDMRARRDQHVKALRAGMHPNRHFQAAWNKYGPAAFIFGIVERCLPEECVEREQYWIDALDAANRSKGYNLSPTASSTLGYKWSEESKARLSASCKGRIIREETRAKLTIASTGRTLSEEAREKIREDHRRRGEEYRQKLREARRNSPPDTEAKRAKATAESNRRREWTEEMRQKVSRSLIGHKRTDESRAKQSASAKGQKRSPEVRARMAEAARRRHQEKPLSTGTRLKISTTLKARNASGIIDS